MNVLITGTSQGIGKAIAERYLKEGYFVYGIDKKISGIIHPNYQHYQVDIREKELLPDLNDIEILINNAGEQNSDDDIGNNLVGTINVTEKYISNPLKAILFNASASAHTGFEFPEYAASKAGVITYMKNVACRLAPRGVVVNSISLGGVLTSLNKPVTDNPELWNKVMNVTPLKKWMNIEEVADWVYFLTVVNKSCSGQDILIDNGEKDLNNTFVWPK